MTDLVKRGDILDALIEKGQKSKRYKWGESWELNLTEIKEAVESVPSAGSELKKGWWLKENLSGYLTPGGNSIYHCSECGHTEGPWPRPRLTNFCPNCGTDMRGE